LLEYESRIVALFLKDTWITSYLDSRKLNKLTINLSEDMIVKHSIVLEKILKNRNGSL
jgi:hypothetical protein